VPLFPRYSRSSVRFQKTCAKLLLGDTPYRTPLECPVERNGDQRDDLGHATCAVRS
jgi:hypothetical protein